MTLKTLLSVPLRLLIRSGKITSKLSDKIEKVEGNSAHDKIKLETADINLSATKVDMSSNSAANSFMRQSRYRITIICANKQNNRIIKLRCWLRRMMPEINMNYDPFPKILQSTLILIELKFMVSIVTFFIDSAIINIKS